MQTEIERLSNEIKELKTKWSTLFILVY
jgi:hypothetical protein